MDKKKIILGSTAGTCCIIIILICVLVPLSLHKLNFDEYGIKYNTMTKELDEDQVYQEGLHNIGPTSKFIIYERTLKDIDMTGNNNILCLTSEGLEMELDITTQYQIIEDKLLDNVKDFENEVNHEHFIQRVTRDTIKDICSQFSGQDYFSSRGDIELAMSDAINITYYDHDVYATSELVQLKNVKHPDAYEDANEAKEAVEQEKDRVLQERQQRLTDKQTEFLTAQSDARILIIAANATANANIIQAEQEASAEEEKWIDRTEALVNIKNGLGSDVSVSQFIREYLNYDVFKKQNNPIIGLD